MKTVAPDTHCLRALPAKLKFNCRRNVTGQNERVTTPVAPITHWLSAHADKLKFDLVCFLW